MPIASELPVDTSASAAQMADAMFGSGITVLNASYTGAKDASGIYSDGDTVASEITPSDTGVILSTGNVTDVTNSSGDVNTSSRTTTRHGEAGDSDLTDLAGMQTYDAAVFEANFIPAGSTLTMQFVFSSEEYLEYVNKGFNDAVGVWVNGEQAELTIGSGDISIDNINDGSNQDLYVDNNQHDDTYNTEMDGFTITLTLTAPVKPGQVNSIKIGIADAGDFCREGRELQGELPVHMLNGPFQRDHRIFVALSGDLRYPSSSRRRCFSARFTRRRCCSARRRRQRSVHSRPGEVHP